MSTEGEDGEGWGGGKGRDVMEKKGKAGREGECKKGRAGRERSEGRQQGKHKGKGANQ